MIHYIKDGDIFSIEGVTNFAHGCNCAGSMGRGIAVQFRKKFPRMYENYKYRVNQQVQVAAKLCIMFEKLLVWSVKI